jgi:hypothetical protein
MLLLHFSDINTSYFFVHCNCFLLWFWRLLMTYRIQTPVVETSEDSQQLIEGPHVVLLPLSLSLFAIDSFANYLATLFEVYSQHVTTVSSVTNQSACWGRRIRYFSSKQNNEHVQGRRHFLCDCIATHCCCCFTNRKYYLMCYLQPY